MRTSVTYHDYNAGKMASITNTKLILFLLLHHFLVTGVRGNPQRFEQTEQGHISDDEIIRALSKLLSQSTPGDKREPSKTNSELRRRPLQRGEHTTINLKPQEDRNVKHIGDEFSFKPRDELDDEEKSLMKDIELARQSLPTSSKLDTCEVTGFETRVREECEDVSEIECRPIQVKKVRTEIRQQCDVKLNKTCDVVFNPAPKDLCSLVTEKRCSIDFNIVAEPKYKEDCHVDVEHICEDYVHIPYPEKPDYGHPPPPPPNDSYGPPVPPPHHHSDEPISDSYGTSKPYNSPTDVYGTPKAPPILSESYAAVPETTGSLSNSYGLPLASSLAGNHHFSTADVNILAAQLFSRTKRNAQREDFAEVQMRELLTTAIMQKMTTTTDEDLFKNLSEMFSSRAKQMKQELETPAPTTSESPGILGGTIREDLPFLEKEIMDEILRRRVNLLGKNTTSVPSVTNSSAHDPGLPSPGVIIGVPLPVKVKAPPPIITVEELPSDPGCRTLATKTCIRTPVIVNKKVPFETCKDVPNVECVTVLKDVPEIECVPEPYTECNDIAIDIPFLEPAEECEEVTFEDCVEIEEKIPIELCTRKRVNEESFFLEKGKVFRKEGEKRRKKIGKRNKQQDDDEKGKEQAEELKFF